jgi:hypothetical protein
MTANVVTKNELQMHADTRGLSGVHPRLSAVAINIDGG